MAYIHSVEKIRDSLLFMLASSTAVVSVVFSWWFVLGKRFFGFPKVLAPTGPFRCCKGPEGDQKGS